MDHLTESVPKSSLPLCGDIWSAALFRRFCFSVVRIWVLTHKKISSRESSPDWLAVNRERMRHEETKAAEKRRTPKKPQSGKT
jgi:hypothetical protein